MKRKYLAFLLLSLCLACGKEHDSKLVGNWTGSEKNGQFSNTIKSWIQNRYKDGTYEIVFIANRDCQTTTVFETGKWWTDNGRFFEQERHKASPSVYHYEILNDSNVKFKIKKSDVEFVDPEYSFVDSKIEHSE